MTYSIAINGTVLAPFGEQLCSVLWIYVKTQHELAEFIQAVMTIGLDSFSVAARG